MSERGERRARWVGKALRGLRTVYDFIPLAPGGALALLGAWVMYEAYGKAQSDYVLRAGAMVVAGLVAVCVLFVTAGAVVLALHIRQRAQPVERMTDTGVEYDTGLRFSRFRWWPLIHLDMTWADPQDVQVLVDIDEGEYVEAVVHRSRGRPQRVRRYFKVSDIFGLAKLRFPWTVTAHLRIAPSSGSIDMTIARREISGDGYSHPSGEPIGERVDMRRYADGDPLRFVLWKVYARTRRLLVRTPERAVAPQPSTVAYFVAGPGDEPVAAAARMFLEAGLFGSDFLLFADGAERPASTLDDALEALIDTVEFRDQGGRDLARVLTEVPPAQLGQLLVFVPPEDGPWRTRLAALVGQLPAPPTVITAIDAPISTEVESRWRRWLWAKDSEPVADLPALYDALITFGGPVQVVHRPSGRLITPAELAAARGVA